MEYFIKANLTERQAGDDKSVVVAFHPLFSLPELWAGLKVVVEGWCTRGWR